MIRVGLLGASRIARPAIIDAAASCVGVEVAAVAASSHTRALAYAKQHGLPRAATGYQAIVTDPEIDLIYNALPPSDHHDWTITALEHGKHVLCEKPMALNADQANSMVAAARRAQRYLVEAFHYRFHPAFARILEHLGSGQLGRIQHIEARFDVHVAERAGEFRYAPELGGGALMDLGCYPVHWVRTLVGEEPVVGSAHASRQGEQIDVAMQAELRFPGGETATVSSSMASSAPAYPDTELCVFCSSGELRANNLLTPHQGASIRLVANGRETRESVAGESTYVHQLRHTLDVVSGIEQPLTGGEDSIANMALIDAIYRAAGMLPRAGTA